MQVLLEFMFCSRELWSNGSRSLPYCVAAIIVVIIGSGVFLLFFGLIRIVVGIGILAEFGHVIVKVADVFAQLLTQSAKRLGIVLAHVLTTFAILPSLVDEIFHFDENANEKSRSNSAFVRGDDGLGLFVSLAQLDEGRLHLIEILDLLAENFPVLTRVGIYASPNSLKSKSVEDLTQLREKKLRILYFGLESGDEETLSAVKKGFTPTEMLALCRKAQDAGMKLSVTAILGLAGKERSFEHARATAEWVTELSPEFFSLLQLEMVGLIN